MLVIRPDLVLADDEIECTAVRAQGAGGQNVNKVSSAIHLRFDIRRSSLPELEREKLLAHADQRITRDGVIVIKSQVFRSQERNRAAALIRLADLIRTALIEKKARTATRPTRAAREKRLQSKRQVAGVKQQRMKVRDL